MNHSLFKDIHQAYLACRRRKRRTANALRFEANLEENLFALTEEVEDGGWIPTRSICFVIDKPKMREIVAADFRDRVLHHYLVERLERLFEPVFIHDSYACRVGKGVHRAIERLRDFIRKGTTNGRTPLYALHLDIKNFFMTIDKDLLFAMVERRIGKDESDMETATRLTELSRAAIFHDPVANCFVKGGRRLLANLPPHKSLFQAPTGKGLPVGNLTSQFFANVYLNELDQYCKHTLKCRYYLRYCDDFIILDQSPQRLAELKEQIRGFVEERLKLELNERYAAIKPVTDGIDALGYILRPDYTLVRRRVVNNLLEKLKRFEGKLVTPLTPDPSPERRGEQNRPSPFGRGWRKAPGEGAAVYHYNYSLLAALRATLASYMGHFKWADSNRLVKSLTKKHPFLLQYFDFSDPWRPAPLFLFKNHWRTLRGQVRYFAGLFPDVNLLVKVGRGYRRVGKTLPPLAPPETGGVTTYKKPPPSSRRGLGVVLVEETGRYLTGVVERLPVLMVRPAP